MKRTKFGEVAELVQETVNPSEYPVVPYIGLEHIAREKLKLLGFGKSSDVSSAKYKFNAGDILFGKLRPYFRKLVVAPFDGLCSTDIWVVRSKKEVTQEYLFYSMASQQFIQFVNSGSVGTRMPRAVWDYVSKYELNLPPVVKQIEVAQILCNLDKKVELNHQTVHTLQEIVQTLFKSWFIDFNLVRAEEKKQSNCLSEIVASLLTGDFIESQLTRIPKGWKVERLGNHITVERGISYTGEDLCSENEGIPIHNLNSIYEGGGYKYEGIKYYKGKYNNKNVVVPGDLIVANTEQGFDRLLIGCAAIVPEYFGSIGLCTHHIYKIKIAKSSPFNSYYLFNLINSPHWHSLFSGYSNGTTINMLPKDAFEVPLVVVPPEKLIEKFTKIVQCIQTYEEKLIVESNIVADIRDLLLPKLISDSNK